MQLSLNLLKLGFESASHKTKEFLMFAKTFKSELKKELETIGAELTDFNTGHFYVSGFFKKEEQLYYFSLSDVRGSEYSPSTIMLYRTAKHNKDWTGGANQYVTLEKGMAKKMVLTEWILR